MSTISPSGFAIENTDIQFVSDALLALFDPHRSWTEKQFKREIPVSQLNADEQIFGALSSGRSSDLLLCHECSDICDRAKLTETQAKVLSMRLEGMTFEEIGDRRGSTKQAAQKVFIHAIKKLAASMRVYRYTGLADVYRNEVRRRGH
jgi:hypothetical protein